MSEELINLGEILLFLIFVTLLIGYSIQNGRSLFKKGSPIHKFIGLMLIFGGLIGMLLFWLWISQPLYGALKEVIG